MFVLFDVRLPVIESCKFQNDALITAHAVKLKVYNKVKRKQSSKTKLHRVALGPTQTANSISVYFTIGFVGYVIRSLSCESRD